jgi:excisionase family DNA binding protein
MKDRLKQLQARQRQLPIDVEELEEEELDEDRPRRASETRQQLVQRLLDPTLTLREAALLIDVCPTTVRRYTDRGLLNCFRTPGNQRRFHLSEVLEFMERRERGEI